MLSSQVSLDPASVECEPRVCSKCLGPMMLTYVKPLLVGFEVRTYTGVKCDHFDQVITEVGGFFIGAWTRIARR